MKIRSPWLTYGIAWVIVCSMRLLFATCRIRYTATEPRTRLDYLPSPDEHERFMLVVWHDELLVPTMTAKATRQAACMVSRHQDGSFLAYSLEIMGYTAVRGSSRKGGAQAARQMMTETAGKHLILTPDGPMGPRREMKPGAVFLASSTGRRLVPGAYACRSSWRIQGSWTDLMIPKPFTTVEVVSGTPLVIPPNLSHDELQQQMARVQTAMDEAEQLAHKLVRGESVSTVPAELRRAA